MEETVKSNVISRAHFACVKAFTQLFSVGTERAAGVVPWDDRTLQDIFDKYQMWAGNMGAMHSDQSWKKSLDYRLREAPFYRTQVTRLLDNLKTSIERVVSSLLEEPLEDLEDAIKALHVEQDFADDDSPWEVSSDSDGESKSYDSHRASNDLERKSGESAVTNFYPSSASSSLDTISFIVECLWRLPIRRPATVNRLKDSSVNDFSCYQKFDILHVEDKFPNIDKRLSKRLGKMISRRRHLLAYRRSHAHALTSTKANNLQASGRKVAGVSSGDATSLVSSDRRTVDTRATTLKLGVPEGTEQESDNSSEPSIASSTSSYNSRKSQEAMHRAIPKRPKNAKGDTLTHFVCPYCLTAQSIRTDRRWRRHVLTDLQPYVCTFPECTLHDYIFDDKNEWFRHETQSHRHGWFCNNEKHLPFDDFDSFLEHMKTVHNQISNEGQIAALKRAAQSPISSSVESCNLCQNKTTRPRAHIAKHLEEVALFALPQTDYMTDTDEEDTKSDVAHRSRHNDLDAGYGPELQGLETDYTVEEVSQTEVPEVESSVAPAISGTDSWDFVTSKFRDAREIMHDGSRVEDPAPAINLLKDHKNLVQPSTKMSGDETGYNDVLSVMNPYHQQRPTCGASIGAFRNDEHLPPISLGGIVLVDGVPYGLTTHHMLDNPSDDESEDDEEVNEDMLPLSSDMNDSEHRKATETALVPTTPRKSDHEAKRPFDMRKERPIAIHRLSGSEGEVAEDADYASDTLSFTSSEMSDDEEGVINPLDSEGDIEGISPGQGEQISITQPAIDDVDGALFPSAEDRDEDHLLSHELGHIYASSGIRRWMRHGVLHEVDWALIKINEDRLQPYNLVHGGMKFSPSKATAERPPLVEPVHHPFYTAEEDEFPMDVLDADSLAGRDVHCFGRTTGLQGGRITDAMSLVRMYGRKTFSHSWAVVGGFGVGGDSGAWVIENGTGRVCGIVLSWCQRNNLAYIQPMQVILEDIKRTLGAQEVVLPRYRAGETNIVTHASRPPAIPPTVECPISVPLTQPRMCAARRSGTRHSTATRLAHCDTLQPASQPSIARPRLAAAQQIMARIF